VLSASPGRCPKPGSGAVPGVCSPAALLLAGAVEQAWLSYLQLDCHPGFLPAACVSYNDIFLIAHNVRMSLKDKRSHIYPYMQAGGK